MKITNFRLIGRTGTNALDWRFTAVVSVTTGLFFKKTQDKEVFKEYGGFWFFVDSGKFTPNTDVEDLQRQFESKQGKITQITITKD